MLDLHRHDEFSFYDGSGKAVELAKIAKEKGFTALGLTNHGNTNGLVKHYDACKNVLIKPVMGCEGYFLPKYIEQHRGYHLILVAKNLIGYKNLNVIQSLGEEQKYYNPIWDFKMLQEHSEGLICTSACVASYSSQCIIKGEYEKAEKYLRKMKEIFGDDFYIVTDKYNNEGYRDYIASAAPDDHIMFFSELAQNGFSKVKNKKLLVFGIQSGITLKEFSECKDIVVVTNDTTPEIYSSLVKTIHHDIEKKANLAMNIMMNALERKFDVKHEYKI